MVIFINAVPCTALIIFIGLDIVLCNDDLEDAHAMNDGIPPETWDNEDYQNWEQHLKTQDEENEEETEDSTWQMPQKDQDSILYDLYDKQPEVIPEIDEDNVELSDQWIILDSNGNDDDNDNRDYEFLNSEENEKDIDFTEETNLTSIDLLHKVENLECDETVIKKKVKSSKLSPKKRNRDEFYFKHKTYGKRPLKKSTRKKIPNWKQNCCIRGKRVGNGRRTYLAENIFQECKERTRSLASRMSRHCKWIFWSCCEARALRRYYIHYQSSQRDLC